ncbi:MAG TPA: hypothetical protein VGN11_01110 [Candidatus Baltobacteraceae bacterium]|nr:hypothetical protein [Candidatus Baltobacteraceae bacterium]
MMDALLAANRLPRLAERAMRGAVLGALARGRLTPRALIDDALLRFERAVGREAPDGIRPSLLFGERDRIVRELRGFIDGRLAARLAALRRRDVIAAGRDASPFDLIVRNRHGRQYAVILRRLPPDGRRLELLRRMHVAAQATARIALHGVLVYDFSNGVARLLLDDAGANGVYRHLRAS